MTSIVVRPEIRDSDQASTMTINRCETSAAVAEIKRHANPLWEKGTNLLCHAQDPPSGAQPWPSTTGAVYESNFAILRMDNERRAGAASVAINRRRPKDGDHDGD